MHTHKQNPIFVTGEISVCVASEYFQPDKKEKNPFNYFAEEREREKERERERERERDPQIYLSAGFFPSPLEKVIIQIATSNVFHFSRQGPLITGR